MDDVRDNQHIRYACAWMAQPGPTATPAQAAPMDAWTAVMAIAIGLALGVALCLAVWLLAQGDALTQLP